MRAKASNKKFKSFLEELHDALPPGFEISIGDEGMSMPATAYAFTAFMRGGTAENCARDFIAKISSIEDNDVDMNDTTIDDWEDQGGAL